MPRIHYLSDLHLELRRHATRIVSRDPVDQAAIACRQAVTGKRPVFWLPDTEADVIVLAGDIDTGTRGVEWAAVESEVLGKPILYVPGNHEYYGRERGAALQAMRERAAGTGVHVLDGDAVVLGGTRFLGATLWTDYRTDEPATPQALAMQIAQQRISDHQTIYTDADQRLFTPADALALHEQARGWLAARLAEPHDGLTVVVTHHGPSAACQHPQYPLGPLSAAFHSDLEALMGPAVDLWIYGHTHACLDTVVRSTRLVSNQLGYPREQIPGYDVGRVAAVMVHDQVVE